MIPQLIAAAKGAIVSAAVQVAEQMILGDKDLLDALQGIDVTEVLTDAALDGVTLGVGTAATKANKVRAILQKYAKAKNTRKILTKKPDGIPKDWIVKPSKKKGGIQYINPNNPHERIRLMPGNPKSKHSSQHKPYIMRQKNGKHLDKNGNIVPRKGPESHIPLKDFKFK